MALRQLKSLVTIAAGTLLAVSISVGGGYAGAACANSRSDPFPQEVAIPASLPVLAGGFFGMALGLAVGLLVIQAVWALFRGRVRFGLERPAD